MWFISIVTLLNAVLNSYEVVNEYLRLPLPGGLILSIWEVALMVGLFWALLRGGTNRARFPAPGVHPLLLPIELLLWIAFFCGVFMVLSSDLPGKVVLTSAREFVALPMAVLIGHQLLTTPRTLRNFYNVSIFAGLLIALILMYHFFTNSEEASVRSDLMALRGSGVAYNSDYAGVAAIALVYALAVGIRVGPRWAMIALACICFVGYQSTLGRSSVVASVVALFAIVFLLPRGRRRPAALKLVILTVVVGLATWVGIRVSETLIGPSFSRNLETHLLSLLPDDWLPSDESHTQAKAWDSRTNAIAEELEMWTHNPIQGNGFGAQELFVMRGDAENDYGFNHNGWTSTLAKTGLIGFAGEALLILGMIVVGARMTSQSTRTLSERPDLNPLERFDQQTFALFGALAFVGGVTFFVRASSTMAFSLREALEFGVLCGMLLRARQMQLAVAGHLQEQPVAAAETDWDSDYGPYNIDQPMHARGRETFDAEEQSSAVGSEFAAPGYGGDYSDN